MTDLFLKLVNMSLTASWLILAVLLLRLIFKRAPRWIFCLLWGFVGLRLVLPFSFESIFSLIPTRTPVQDAVSNFPADRVTVGNGIPTVDLPVGEIIPPAVNTVPGAVPAPDPVVTAPSSPSFIQILAMVWICGIAAMLVYALVSYIRLKLSLRTATIYEKNVWQSEEASSPFVLGLFRPRIYLPYTLDELDMPYVLSHERAHIARRDHLIKPLGFLVLSVYWFNPVIWLAYILLCRDVEVACDEKVIKAIGEDNKRNYSTALLNCSISRTRIAACPIAFGEVAVKERIKGVMNYRKPTFWIIILAVIAVIVTAVCFLTDPKTKDEEKEDEVSAEYSDEPVEIIFDRYEAGPDNLIFELKTEMLDPVDPMIELRISNDDEIKDIKLLWEMRLYRMDDGEWQSCSAFYPDENRYLASPLPAKMSDERVYDLKEFDLTKAGQYRLDINYVTTAFEAEGIKTGSVYFDLAAPIANPLDNEELIRDDLIEYMSWLPQYMSLYGGGSEIGGAGFYSVYPAMRYCYENELSFVKMNEDSFRISRDDLLEVYMTLTGDDEYTAVGTFERNFEYLAKCGDSYDHETNEFIFTLNRDNWGDCVSLGISEYNPHIDPSRELKISEGYNFSTVTAWITYHGENGSARDNYYEAELYFKHVELDGHIAYKLIGIRYKNPPIVNEVTLTAAKDHSIDGFFTEFQLMVGSRLIEFEGKAISDIDDLSIDQMTGHTIYYNSDLTGDGIWDVVVNLQITGSSSQYSKKSYDVHVFDGASLREIPVEKDIPQKVAPKVNLVADDEQYLFDINGEKHAIRKAWFTNNPGYAEIQLYDIPRLDEDYIFTSDNGVLRCEMACSVCRYRNYDMIYAELEYKDGKLVLGRIYTDGFSRESGYPCGEHNGAYHSFPDSLIDLVGYEAFNEWRRSLPHYEYNDNGCTDPASLYSFAKHFGLTEKQLRDVYYQDVYYQNEFYGEKYSKDPSCLFELDEAACDEFFRDPSNFDKQVYEFRQAERTFKDVILRMLRGSEDAQRRSLYFALTDNGTNRRYGYWSIPELVYAADITLEELQEIYDIYISPDECKYDFERLFTEREYFEEQIEKAEYPVFVDMLLRK